MLFFDVLGENCSFRKSSAWMDGARIQGGILIVHARKLIDQDEDRQKVAILFKVGRKTLYRALAVS